MEKTLSDARVFSFLSPKGGSGKTITAITLAIVLSGLDKRVLIVDADASTNGLSLFYLDEITQYKSKHEHGLLFGTLQAEDATTIDVVSVENGIDIAPASFLMNQTEHTNPAQFQQRIENMRLTWLRDYEYIFIDAQAGTDAFAEIAAKLADEIVVVSEYDPISSRGVERLKVLFEKAFEDKAVWTLYNKILPEFVQGVGDFLAIAGFLRPIPWDADVVRAYVRRRCAVDMNEGNLHTLAAMDCAISLLGRRVDREIEEWKRTRVESVKKPASSKLKEVNDRIASVEMIKAETKYRAQTFRKSLNYIVVFYLITVVGILIILPSAVTLPLGAVLFAVFAVLFSVWLRVPFLERFLNKVFGDYSDEELERKTKESDREIEQLHEERQRLATFATIQDMSELLKMKAKQ
jgi:cellulose biosynthesis protein BcsQ